MSKKKTQEAATFKDGITKLESIIESIERENTSLEDSLKLFEEGVNLTRQIQANIAKAEQHVRTLVETDSGLLEQDFDPDGD